MSKQLITKAEEIRDEVRVGANTAKRVGGMLAEMAREVNGLYDNVLDWIKNEKPQGGGFILTQSDVVNSLADESQLKPLSAMQGKILKTILDSLVVDDLVTDDDTKALSARQGKHLADEISGLSEVYQPVGDYQAAGSYAPSVHMHTAAQVTEQTNKRFMTDAEREAISSLGTSYAKADFSNITSKSMGQNGYYKLPDGLLVQWGFAPGATGTRSVYLPISFYDTNYSVLMNEYLDSESEATYSTHLRGKYTSYFRAKMRYSSRGVEANAPDSFYWIAIGRWK